MLSLTEQCKTVRHFWGNPLSGETDTAIKSQNHNTLKVSRMLSLAEQCKTVAHFWGNPLSSYKQTNSHYTRNNERNEKQQQQQKST